MADESRSATYTKGHDTESFLSLGHLKDNLDHSPTPTFADIQPSASATHALQCAVQPKRPRSLQATGPSLEWRLSTPHSEAMKQIW